MYLPSTTMSPASLSPILTPTLLSSIRKHPQLPQHTWYLITATTLSTLNRPDEIPTVYKYAIEHGSEQSDPQPTNEEQLKISRRMREALVKAGVISGLPKSINALLELKKATPQTLIDEPLAYSPTARPVDIYDVPSSHILHRGQTFFDRIYGKISKRIMRQMDQSGTEDLGLVARLLYGYILSNTNVLTSAETSYVLIAGLIPQDVNPQLKGHLRGALNGGATVEQVKAVRDIVIRICEAAGMKRISDDVPAGFGWREEVADL